jgi:hypothetical protein
LEACWLSSAQLDRSALSRCFEPLKDTRTPTDFTSCGRDEDRAIERLVPNECEMSQEPRNYTQTGGPDEKPGAPRDYMELNRELRMTKQFLEEAAAAALPREDVSKLLFVSVNRLVFLVEKLGKA